MHASERARSTPLSSLDYSLLAERYGAIVDVYRLDLAMPLVIRHRNVVEYVRGVNPIVDYSPRRIAAAKRLWRAVEAVFRAHGARVGEPPEGVRAIAVLYPYAAVAAPRPPDPAAGPVDLYLVKEGEVLALRVRVSTMLRHYVAVLRRLARAAVARV